MMLLTDRDICIKYQDLSCPISLSKKKHLTVQINCFAKFFASSSCPALGVFFT